MANCCVVSCSNSYYRLQRWFQSSCEIHPGKNKADCGCDQPFQLVSFPKNEPVRSVWVKLVNRKQGKENWQPKLHTKICSTHFNDGLPTDDNPYPMLNMGYELPAAIQARKPPKLRALAVHSPNVHSPNLSNIEPLTQPKITKNNFAEHNYSFAYKCDCSEQCACTGCLIKELKIKKLKAKILELETELHANDKPFKGFSVDSILKSDKKVRIYLGLPNRKTFCMIFELAKKKCQNVRYWKSKSKPVRIVSSKVTNTKVKRKPGPERKLSIKHELMITLMKLRLNVTHEFLSDVFGISSSLLSQILSTWIRLLSHLFINRIYHPDKEEVRRTLPASFRTHVPNARGIIDCSEFFIERPNSLDAQAATWSDYKQHNTVKVLIDISPTGIIQFLSEAWGGRVSDKHIVLQSGYLDTIEPGDTILADRGFPIEEELLLRGARLYIPPGARGAEQMSREKVLKTKKVANLRIHVERAINRLKWFKILSDTLPLSMVSLINHILIICSALINLYPPLVK